MRGWRGTAAMLTIAATFASCAPKMHGDARPLPISDADYASRYGDEISGAEAQDYFLRRFDIVVDATDFWERPRSIVSLSEVLHEEELLGEIPVKTLRIAPLDTAAYSAADEGYDEEWIGAFHSDDHHVWMRGWDADVLRHEIAHARSYADNVWALIRRWRSGVLNGTDPYVGDEEWKTVSPATRDTLGTCTNYSLKSILEDIAESAACVWDSGKRHWIRRQLERDGPFSRRIAQLAAEGIIPELTLAYIDLSDLRLRTRTAGTADSLKMRYLAASEEFLARYPRAPWRADIRLHRGLIFWREAMSLSAGAERTFWATRAADAFHAAACEPYTRAETHHQALQKLRNVHAYYLHDPRRAAVYGEAADAQWRRINSGDPLAVTRGAKDVFTPVDPC